MSKIYPFLNTFTKVGVRWKRQSFKLKARIVSIKLKNTKKLSIKVKTLKENIKYKSTHNLTENFLTTFLNEFDIWELEYGKKKKCIC